MPPRFELAPELFSKTFQLQSRESTTGGIARANSDTLTELDNALAGSEAVAERFDHLQKQVAAELTSRTKEHRTCWSSDQFPQFLIDQMYEQSPSRFEAWINALLADKLRAKLWWGGLLIPVFRTAIRTGHTRARDLWPLVFPFQRDHVSCCG